MTGPVDVLAGIKLASRDCRAEGRDMAANELLDIAAAVAELIAADKAFDEAIATYGISSRWSVQANERRRDAIAAATGDKS